MSPDLVTDLNNSFARAFTSKRALGRRFYELLFERAPGLRRFFPDDLGLQQEKLMETLGSLVRDAGNCGAVAARMRELGRRHAAYGAEPAHFDLVGALLLEVLIEIVPGPLSSREATAWATVIAQANSGMIDGLRAERLNAGALHG